MPSCSISITSLISRSTYLKTTGTVTTQLSAHNINSSCVIFVTNRQSTKFKQHQTEMCVKLS